jgi:hypothetical protein
MNASPRTEVLRETNQVQKHRTHPGVAAWPQEVCFREPGRHEDPDRPEVSDEADFPTFVDGAGI